MKLNGSTIIILSSFLLLTLTFAISIFFDIPFGVLSRDPLAGTGVNPINGLLSNFGAVFWSISVGISFFTYFVLPVNTNTHHKTLIAYSGFLSLLLLLDDFFMLHDKIIPYLLGIKEIYIFLFYGISIIFYLFYFRKAHLKTNYITLIIALIMFGTSMIIDVFQDQIASNYRIIYEDSAKFIGIAFWVNYHYIICRQMVINNSIA